MRTRSERWLEACAEIILWIGVIAVFGLIGTFAVAAILWAIQ